MYSIGFIGAGNMAGALMRGMMRGNLGVRDIVAYDLCGEKVLALGVAQAHSVEEAARLAPILVVAVKPKDVRDVLRQLRDAGYPGALVSIAAGWTQEKLAECFPGRAVVRMMPNTPALVGEGMIAIAENHTAPADMLEKLTSMLASCGRVMLVPEAQMDAVVGISGSGPAYLYMFLEAFADAGVRQGLPRERAYTLAAQTMLGAAKMVLETGMHPGALKDAVCSPGGTTIEAVYALEKAGLRGAVMDAVDACARRAAQMAGK